MNYTSTLCLDVGTKRIGVAASDKFGWTAQPVCVITRADIGHDLERIANICNEREIKQIVVGIPLNQESEVGREAAKIQRFADRLKIHLIEMGMTIDFVMWDERYSTIIAEERLIGANLSRKKRKRIIDKMAAVVILEEFLAAHTTRG